MQQLQLHIKSFDFFYIQQVIKKISILLSFLKTYSINSISLAESNTKIGSQSLFSLPNYYKKFTLIRSPHIDKKSREQFQKKKVKSILYFTTDNAKTIFLLTFMLKNLEFPGVEIQVHYKYSTFLK